MFSWLTWHIVEMLFLRFPTLAACRLHCESFESLWLFHICWVPPSSILGIIKVVKWLKFNENRFLLNKCKLFLSLPSMGLKKDASMEDADHDKLFFWNFRDKINFLHMSFSPHKIKRVPNFITRFLSGCQYPIQKSCFSGHFYIERLSRVTFLCNW